MASRAVQISLPVTPYFPLRRILKLTFTCTIHIDEISFLQRRYLIESAADVYKVRKYIIQVGRNGKRISKYSFSNNTTVYTVTSRCINKWLSSSGFYSRMDKCEMCTLDFSWFIFLSPWSRITYTHTHTHICIYIYIVARLIMRYKSKLWYRHKSYYLASRTIVVFD